MTSKSIYSTNNQETKPYHFTDNRSNTMNKCGKIKFEGSKHTQIEHIAKKHGFVWFYKKEENPYTAIFGNFAPAKVEYNGRTFRNAEAAYQSEKYSNNKLKEKFTSVDGEGAWQLSRSRKSSDEESPNPHFNKLITMRAVVMAKFSQNEKCKDALLSTGNAYLVEHTPKKGRDKFWADDNDGSGENNLGKILMQTRKKLGGTGEVSVPNTYLCFVNQKT